METGMWGYWQLSLRLLLLGVLIPLSTGVTMALTGYFMTRNAADLETHSDVVRARIRDSEARGDRFWVAFEYVDETSALHRGEALLNGPGAVAAKMAGFLEIRYDRRRPELYYLATSERHDLERSLRTGTLALGCLMILGSLFALARRTVHILGIVRLLHHGSAVATSVRTHVLSGLPAGQTRFTYAYQGTDGRWFEGRSPVLPAEYLHRFPVGQPILVVYDRQQPRRSEVDLFGIRARQPSA